MEEEEKEREKKCTALWCASLVAGRERRNSRLILLRDAFYLLGTANPLMCVCCTRANRIQSDNNRSTTRPMYLPYNIYVCAMPICTHTYICNVCIRCRVAMNL